MAPTTLPIRKAILSVSDKTGLVPLAQALADQGVQLFSSGGTARHLAEAGITTTEVSAYTGFPEMMGGRLKTLHPKVAGGILCRRNLPDDLAAAEEHGIALFDLVVVNLYPFAQTVAQEGTSFADAIEQIDIGGPTLVRAAAKNHAFVAIATAPSQYEEIIAEFHESGGSSADLRRKLAAAAFAHTAAYDAGIADYFARQTDSAAESVPSELPLTLRHHAVLRYGENPHQAAGLYVADRDPSAQTLVGGKQLHGKELSYNNWLDLDAARKTALALPQPSAVVIKHNNPCGAAHAASAGDAIAKAWEGDPVSAFGSIIALNSAVTAEVADFLISDGRFVEAIVAPAFDKDAFEILTTKPKWKASVRLVETSFAPVNDASWDVRSIDGGYLVQQSDQLADDANTWEAVTTSNPSAEQQRDLQFAWEVCRFIKSNAIVLVRDQAIVGVGAGQMSRVDAVEIALRKAGDKAQGAVLASDAFFPFADSIQAAAAGGVTAFIEPGGSRRDDEVIAAANELGLPILFTGRRHFRH